MMKFKKILLMSAVGLFMAPGFAHSESLMDRFSTKFLNTEGHIPEKVKAVERVASGGEGLSMSALNAANEANEAVASKMLQHNGFANVVYPETTQDIVISAKEQNRFVCVGGTLEAIRHSQELEKDIDLDGNEGFVKMKFSVDTEGKVTFQTTPTDLFIKCDGETYSLIIHPSTKINSKTFYLISPTKQKEAEREEMRQLSSLPVDDAVAKLVEIALKDNQPSSWHEIPLKKVKSPVKGIFLEPTGNWHLNGVDIQVSMYRAHAISNITGLSEWDFVKPELMVNPIGVSVRFHDLAAGSFTPVVIVQKVEGKR